MVQNITSGFSCWGHTGVYGIVWHNFQITMMSHFGTPWTRPKPGESPSVSFAQPRHGRNHHPRRGVEYVPLAPWIKDQPWLQCLPHYGYTMVHPNQTVYHGLSSFSPWKNTFPFGSFEVCPILRQTLTIGRFPVRFAGTWSSVALRPTRHWGITLNASWTGLTGKSQGLTVGGNIKIIKGKRWFLTPNDRVFPWKLSLQPILGWLKKNSGTQVMAHW